MGEDGSNTWDGYRSTLAQTLASMAPNLLLFNVGMMSMMPTYVIGALRLGDPHLFFTEEQASWFGGMIYMIQPLGALFSGFIQDHLGRRNAMMIVNIPQIPAWLIIYYSTSVTTLFAAVIIMALCFGVQQGPALTYTGEVIQPRLRGVLSTLTSVFVNLGFLTEAFIGAAVDWRVMALVSTTFPILSLICLAMIPESPAWLVSKGRVEQARLSYQWLRGWVSPETVQGELDTLLDYVKSSKSPEIADGDFKVPTLYGTLWSDSTSRPLDASYSNFRLFLSPAVQRPLRLIVILYIVSSSTGLLALRTFFIEVLYDFDIAFISEIAVVLCALVSLLGSLTITLTIRRVGRRVITFLCLAVCTVCCLGLALYFSLGLQIPWLPLVLFSVCSFASAFKCVPWILISELFPLRVRGLATAVTVALGNLTLFINIKTYYSLVSLVNVSGACFLYGSVGAVGLVYLYIVMPETEGVTLQSIERMYSGDENKRLNRV